MRQFTKKKVFFVSEAVPACDWEDLSLLGLYEGAGSLCGKMVVLKARKKAKEEGGGSRFQYLLQGLEGISSIAPS